jgi:hypothetical protein
LRFGRDRCRSAIPDRRGTTSAALDPGRRSGQRRERGRARTRPPHLAAEPSELDDLVLGTPSGERVRLSEELADADFVMMIATSGDGAAAASTIGTACTLRGIMTAAVVLGTSGAADDALVALRPNARVLLVSDDWRDVAEVLSAVGS